MRILVIIIILLGMGVSYQKPIHHVFDWSYEREICIQAHKYHGILSSDWWLRGEPTFEREGVRCNLISTIKRWEVVL